jgi:predicted transcriptional regulator
MGPHGITRRGLLTATAAGAVVSMAGAAHAAPALGQPFPRFSTRDLAGNPKTQKDLSGSVTLVVVITSPSASDRLNQWMSETQAAFPDTVVRRVVLLALDLAFIVPSVVVRDKARRKVPRQYWKDTMLDVHGDLAKQLGLEKGSDSPFVYVLDKTARVTAAVRGALDAKTRAIVWSALRAAA